jgi:hypothetical protein
MGTSHRLHGLKEKGEVATDFTDFQASPQKSRGGRSGASIAGSYEADLVKPLMRFSLFFSPGESGLRVKEERTRVRGA